MFKNAVFVDIAIDITLLIHFNLAMTLANENLFHFLIDFVFLMYKKNGPRSIHKKTCNRERQMLTSALGGRR